LVNSKLSNRFVQLGLLAVQVSAATYSLTILASLQEAVQASLALTDNQIALLQGPALAIPAVLGAIPLGLVADRVSRTRLLLLLICLLIAGNLLTATAASLPFLFLARCVTGFAFLGTSMVGYIVVADLFPAGQLGRASIVMAIGQLLGPSASFALGGRLLVTAGQSGNAWRWAMLWMIAPVALAVIASLFTKEPPRIRLQSPEKNYTREAFQELRTYLPVLVPFWTAGLLIDVSENAAFTWALPTFSRTFLLPPDRVGEIMAMAMLATSVIAPFLAGGLSDFCQRTGGPRRTFTVLAWLSVLSILGALFPLMPTPEIGGVFLAEYKILGFVFQAMMMTLSNILVPSHIRGLMRGISSTLAYLVGMALAPFSVSLLTGYLGGPSEVGNSLAIVCVIGGILSAAAFGFSRRFLPAVNAEASEADRSRAYS
jgi:MFS family permease